MEIPNYNFETKNKLRFVSYENHLQLVNLYGLTGFLKSKSDKIRWSAEQFHKMHPEIPVEIIVKELIELFHS